MKRIVLASVLMFLQSIAAHAQSSVYVSGAVFADLERGSGQSSPVSTRPDATVAGGGIRVGGFLAPRWSIELSIDAGGTIDATASLSPLLDQTAALGGVSRGVIPIVVSVDERIRSRVTATSALVGYHLPARGRLHAGFKGGVSFVRSSDTITSTVSYRTTDPLLLPFLTLPAPITTTSSSVVLSTAATVAAELAIALSSHAAIVPEVRAFGFGGRLAVRPGAAVRWSF